MKLKRTANAGVLLELDGKSILLDGVCREVKPYPATPQEERERLSTCWPDVVAYTHAHKDHYDPAYAVEYTRQTGRVILGPNEAGGVRGSMQNINVGNISVIPIPCRHIGLAGKDTPHCGFVISGSKNVWFTGDSSPLHWKNRGDLPEPDVMIVPYAFANSKSSWEFTKNKASKIVLLHMPEREDDVVGLWASVEDTVKDMGEIIVPEMLETVTIM